MNSKTTNTGSRTLAYFKFCAFLLPGLVLWWLAGVFIVPKIQQICASAGMPNATFFWASTEFNIRSVLFFKEFGVYLALGLGLILFMLEWKAGNWAIYRNTILGAGAVLVNTMVLFSFYMMLVVITTAAPALANLK
jgi:hypothetical protein